MRGECGVFVWWFLDRKKHANFLKYIFWFSRFGNVMSWKGMPPVLAWIGGPKLTPRLSLRQQQRQQQIAFGNDNKKDNGKGNATAGPLRGPQQSHDNRRSSRFAEG